MGGWLGRAKKTLESVYVSNPLAEAGPGALASARSTLDVVRVQGMEVDIGEAVEAAVRAPTAAHWRQR